MTRYVVMVINTAGGPPREWTPVKDYSSKREAIAERHRLNDAVSAQVGRGGRGNTYEVFADGVFADGQSINPYE